MNFPYYDSQQGYRQAPVQDSFDRRRESSFALQSQTQPFPHQNFHPQAGGLAYEPQYAFDQSSDWTHGHVAPVDFQPSGASQLNVAEINEITRSAREAPWDPAGGTQARTVENSLQQYSPATPSYVSKAHTVAGATYPPPVFKQPPLKQRQSYGSVPDSGYGSQATLNESIPGISQAETKHSVFLPADPPQSVTEAPARALSVKTDPNPIRSTLGKRRRSKSFLKACEVCGKELKNPSEAQKHELQHTKPHRCDRCSRKDGFATVNDLERHKKSVHGASPKVGKTSVYYCKACPNPTAGIKAKPWPRLDNYKAHIKRKHAEFDPDQLIQASECEKPLYAESQYAYSQYSASIPTNDMEYQQDLSSPIGHSMTRHTSQQQDMNILFGQNSTQQLAHVGGIVDYPTNNNMREQPIHFQVPQYSGADGMSTLYYAAHQLASPVDSMISPTNTRQSAPSIHLNDHALPQYEDMEVDMRQNKRPRTASMPSPSVSHATVSSAMGSAEKPNVSPSYTEGEHRCTQCNKVKKRECDLRKHMKRHTRPYGCTFAKCNKKFGSRNDWKRHENSQHFLSEMWRCEIKRPKPNSDSRCGFLSHDQQQFAQHLANKHGLKIGTDEMKKQCRDMHLGREGHHHYWCGFCNKLIEQEEGIQPGAWDVRFKHIGDHFDKHNLNIDDWVDIEKNKKKKFINHEEQNKKPGSKLRVDDDSDLGEDGIEMPVPVVYAAQTGRAKRVVNEEADADGVSDDEMYNL